MTFHFECSGDGWQHHESEGWGECQRFIEVLDDQRANRQIEVYRGGQVLVYDRMREMDRYGRLVGLRFSRKDKWRVHFSDVSEMSLADFEKVCRRFAGRALQQTDVPDDPSGAAERQTC
ncbi:MAG: hypothetical protein ACI8X5_000455 [Planctomycetota bacterium]|jgi:hypothetical protein